MKKRREMSGTGMDNQFVADGQREEIEVREQENSQRERENCKEILYRYVTVLGAFAERYYNPEHLINPESRVIPPDILAAYRMAVVLADGTASSENVAVLKQALEIFPPFHEEIRSVLMKLA